MIQFVFVQFIFALCAGVSGLTIMAVRYRVKKTMVLKDMFIYNVLFFLSILIYGIGKYSTLFGFIVPPLYGTYSIPVFMSLACLRFFFIVRLSYGLVGMRANARNLMILCVSSVVLIYACAYAIVRLGGYTDAWKMDASVRSALKDFFVIVPVILCSAFLFARRQCVHASVYGLCVASTAIMIVTAVLFCVSFAVNPDICRQYVDIPMIVFILLNVAYTVFFVRAMRAETCGGRETVSKSRSYEEISRVHGVTRREYEIILLVAEGLSYAQVGERLFISPNTVRNHVSSAYRKLGIDNKIQLYKTLSVSSLVV